MQTVPTLLRAVARHMSPQSFLCRGTPWCCWQKRLRERGCRKSSLCPWDTEPDRPEASLERRCGGVQGVALNFRQIFSELVPGGKGELVMQRRAPVPLAQDAEDGEEEAEQQNASEKYSGVFRSRCASRTCLSDILKALGASYSWMQLKAHSRGASHN